MESLALLGRLVAGKDARYQGLHTFLQGIEPGVRAHLGLVREYFPTFDCHDISHSRKVIENMEAILGSCLEHLGALELFFLCGAGLLHDCAMALPHYERNVLMACEGQKGFFEESAPVHFGLDGKRCLSQREMRERIERNAKELYGGFAQRAGDPFPFADEASLVADLAQRARAYQAMRNGRGGELRELARAGDREGYLRRTKAIRADFIRTTHPQRCRVYIANLARRFPRDIYGNTGEQLCADLGRLCAAHGETDIRRLGDLGEAVRYFGGETVNLAFLAHLLRVGDILHFSMDRAPLALFAETDVGRNLHWTSKLQGLDCAITRPEGEALAAFSAACGEAEAYYFIRDYIGEVEKELAFLGAYVRGYLKHSGCGEGQRLAYGVRLCARVDISGLRPLGFTPVENMRFTLEKRRILELLMGEQLYQDPFACLRELYQNALDACRCMAARDGRKGEIEFGLGEDIRGGMRRRYLYCADNGTGMTREIIENHFLKIGSSYYRSPAFVCENTDCAHPFTPTSQFGIGILSCFMLCDSMEVTTRHYLGREALCFAISGVHERFYYTSPDPLDLEEKLPGCGTLIKLYLKDGIQLSDEAPAPQELAALYRRVGIQNAGDFRLFLRGLDTTPFDGYYPQKRGAPEPKTVKTPYLALLLHQYVAGPKRGVPVYLRRGGSRHALPALCASLDAACGFTPGQLWQSVTAKYTFDPGGSAQVGLARALFLSGYPQVRKQVVTVFEKGIAYFNVLFFPAPAQRCPSALLAFCRHTLLNFAGYLVDGIAARLAQGVTVWGENFQDSRGGDGYFIDFSGEERPTLSVDRRTILSIPPALQKTLHTLRRKAARAELRHISRYFQEHGIAAHSPQAETFWEYYFKSRVYLGEAFHKEILACQLPVAPGDLRRVCENGTVASVVRANALRMRPIHLGRCSPCIAQLLMRKIAEAPSLALDGEGLILSGCHTISPALRKRVYRFDGYTRASLPFYFRADTYAGPYAQFDMTTLYMPLIGEALFRLLVKSGPPHIVEGRVAYREEGKSMKDHDLCDFMNIDAFGIHPGNGIYTPVYWCENRAKSLGRRWCVSDTRLFDPACNYFIYIYVGPGEPNGQEAAFLAQLEEADPLYCRGVREGWSLLLLNEQEFMALPGVVPREALLKSIPAGFWAHNEGKPCRLADGTPVTPEYIRTL